MKNIKDFINLNIRPYITSHGGDIEIINYNSITKELSLRLRGQCSTCPQSIDTIENKIKNSLMDEFPNLSHISVNAGVSDELLDMAKLFLSKEGL